jgi:hypothetical protein
MDIEKEKERLARAEKDISAANQRIARQKGLIEELRRDGHDTTTAEEVLQILQTCRLSQERHLRLLAREIHRVPQESELAYKSRAAIAESRQQLAAIQLQKVGHNTVAALDERGQNERRCRSVRGHRQLAMASSARVRFAGLRTGGVAAASSPPAPTPSRLLSR